MSLLRPSKQSCYTIVVGCGRLGSRLAQDLSDQGVEVLVMDREEANLARLSSSFGGLTQVADATDMPSLEEAGIQDAYAVVIVTNDDLTNIMVAQIAREMYAVEHVVARVYDPSREAVYRRLGIKTICPVRHSASKIESILMGEDH